MTYGSNIFNKVCNVVYPGGAGGEFLCWLLSQSPHVSSLGVEMDDGDKFTVNPNEIPNHIHKEYEEDSRYNKKFNSYNFNPELVNMCRDHARLRTPALEEEYIYTRYDKWQKSMFILLVPSNQESVDFVKNNMLQKVKIHNKTEFTLKKYQKGLERMVNVIGSRKHIIVDPFDLYVRSTKESMDYILQNMRNTLNSPVKLTDRTIIKFMQLRQ